ncbi:cupin domain-containing protein [Antarctobacter jejuensis]|uniref:cupin domain-containing protein n=1 Tax=Antarctobacter jejuensis TaxID=1439938 RepID=UPI003FCF2D81
MSIKTKWNGMEYEVLTDRNSGVTSIGAFVSLDAPGAGPPRHIHHDADESFYILSGEVDFWIAGKTIPAQAGQMLTVPRGTEHAFLIVGERPARMLTILTPGGFEHFFSDVAAENLRISEDLPRISEIGKDYHLSFTGPPMAAPATEGARA